MNGSINHTNYEAWLLDRLEGTLTPDQERKLDAFLLLHPELAPIGEELPTVGAILDQLSAAEKENLKRTLPPTGPISRVNEEDHIIARLEGDLGPNELTSLAAHLKEHPELQRVERLYALTKLNAQPERFAEIRELERHFPPTSTVNAFTLTDHLIAQFEGDLGPTQEKALEAYLRTHFEAQHQKRLVQAARIPVEHIAYSAKAELKKGGRAIPISAGRWTFRLAAAASIAVLLGLGTWFLLMRSPHAPEFVRVESKRSAPTSTQPIEETQNAIAQAAHKEEEARVVREKPDALIQKAPEPLVLTKEDQEPHHPVAPVDHSSPEIQPLPQQKDSQQQPAKKMPDDPALKDELLTQAPERVPSTVRGTEQTTSLRGLLATTVRETLLDEPDRNTSPLDGDDAVAAVDRGLKVVGGHRAGLTVGRNEGGGVNTFQLRFGRKFGITASR